jgi:uncharacterized lipoprotein YmbA
MRCGEVRRAFHAPLRLSHLSGVVAATLLAALAAGCSSQQTARLVSINAAAVPNATVTFESIDGPPPEVFRRLVASLNDEAAAQQVAVVPRQAAATYRVRGYVTALVDRDRTSFAWVWDVYDGDKRRALRITGEEPAPGHRGRDAWSVADERVLSGISRAGMERIATFLNAPDPMPGSAPALAPALVLPALLSTRDDSPEAAGIFRIFSGSDQPAPPPREPEAEAPKQPKPLAPAAAPKQRSAALAQ